jgi:hypothetical protein
MKITPHLLQSALHAAWNPLLDASTTMTVLPHGGLRFENKGRTEMETKAVAEITTLKCAAFSFDAAISLSSAEAAEMCRIAKSAAAELQRAIEDKLIRSLFPAIPLSLASNYQQGSVLTAFDVERIYRQLEYERRQPLWRFIEDQVMADLDEALNQPGRHHCKSSAPWKPTPGHERNGNV